MRGDVLKKKKKKKKKKVGKIKNETISVRK